MLKTYFLLVSLLLVVQFVCAGKAIGDSYRQRRQTIDDCPKENVEFHLFTKLNPKNSQILKIGDKKSITNSNFNKSWPVRFIIHGWRDTVSSEVVTVIRDAYLKNNNFNVIGVDWSQCQWRKLFLLSFYTKSTKMVPYAAQIITDFAKFLHNTKELEIPYDNMYLIGHSLGSHVAGYAGQYLRPDQFKAIFVLDPAGPEFEGTSTECRIDKSDAKYVESIHTTLFWGYDKPIGHASFYPNYGVNQRCGWFCDHLMSYRYFAESINSPEKYKGFKCENYDKIRNQACSDSGESAFMGDTSKYGDKSNFNKAGIFYVKVE